MATHFCIGNPCWICYPKYDPKPSKSLYSIDELVEMNEAPKHFCKIDRGGCRCSSMGLEPCDYCQGGMPWPPRCEKCGRFMSWREDAETA